MVIFFIPIVPIIIFLFLLASGIANELIEALNTIHTILIVVFLAAFLYTFIHVLRNAASENRKIGAAVLSVISCIVSLIALDYFIDSLAAIENSVFMVFEFGFTAFIGGALLLLLALGSIILCLHISGD